MTNVFTVDTARIAAASGDIDRIAATIESEVSALDAKLTALEDCWRGTAAARFQAVKQEWAGTQAQVRTTLQHIGATLRLTGLDYEQVEHTNQARFAPH